MNNNHELPLIIIPKKKKLYNTQHFQALRDDEGAIQISFDNNVEIE